MDVIDSTKDLAEGKVKDARYLAKKFMPIMSKVDPEKELFDLVAFDGTANVQKAGRIIKEKFPKVEVIQGAEHLGSLFLSKCFKEPCLQLLKTWTNIVSFLLNLFDCSNSSQPFYFHLIINQLQNVFGFVRHAEHAIFKEVA